MDNVLEVTGLTTRFSKESGTITVVDQLDLHVKRGETLGIVGESGCGKSATSLSLMRLLDNNATLTGSIRFNGKEVLTLSEAEMRSLRGKEMAMIFQEPMHSLNPVLTIGRQISEVLHEHEGDSKAAVKQRVLDLLTVVGISRAEEIYRDYPHRLSGGMRQRVMIAMAIACNPSLLIADEPTTALDVTIQAQILNLIKKIRKDIGMSVIMITHDLGVVAEVCDRVMVMYAGQAIETADVRSLLRNPKHPYTVGLLQSTPRQRAKRLHSIKGSVPTSENKPNGCRFAPRCDRVMTICWERNPVFHPVDQHSSCRCWLFTQDKDHDQESSVVGG
ncbi:ABC transporter ATP-binding protein [Brevibacillus fortis]|uniref:Peptide ABC transporter ATP-binding protein n=1 Tax=Brevibacillus fortis TaxID=2126352 RepID=A0A2P7V8F6_9BACL|nr:ABC transporter ATP-binding protein [Brevibacillus fortis]PSJ95491.1 peptide ABC transporter ATP-binding protein [Brevibacillus fortis]